MGPHRLRPSPSGAATGALAARAAAVTSSLIHRNALKASGAGRPGPVLEPLLVVLDLDETLLHATLLGVGDWRGGGELPDWVPTRIAQPTVDFVAEGNGLILGLAEDIPLHVSLRPGAAEFVEWLSQAPGIELAVYTAGTPAYARQTLARLGLGHLDRVLFRDECVPFGLPITKDLTKLRCDLSRVVLVDNDARNFWLQADNGLLVSDWVGRDPSDRELCRVRAVLEELADAGDVRATLSSLRCGPPPWQGRLALGGALLAAAAAAGAAALGGWPTPSAPPPG